MKVTSYAQAVELVQKKYGIRTRPTGLEDATDYSVPPLDPMEDIDGSIILVSKLTGEVHKELFIADIPRYSRMKEVR